MRTNQGTRGWGIAWGMGLFLLLTLGGACKSVTNFAKGPYSLTLRGRPDEVALVCLITGTEEHLLKVDAEVKEGKTDFMSLKRQRDYWDFAQLLQEEGAWQVLQNDSQRQFVHRVKEKDQEGQELALRIARSLGSEEGAAVAFAVKFDSGRWRAHVVRNAELAQLAGALVELTADNLRFKPKS